MNLKQPQFILFFLIFPTSASILSALSVFVVNKPLQCANANTSPEKG
jgi:hypothetical protein